MKLIILESPNKIKKVKKYVGSDYEVIASIGHFNELKNEGKFNLGINVDNDFKHNYQATSEKKKVIRNIIDKSKLTDEILIATDPDREGEIIGWHILNVIKSFKKPIKRIAFNAITKKDIQNALENPRDLDMDLVDAAMAREGLDKMIGFMISPEVRRNTNGSSAGRVQTPTLGIIVDRFRERENFVSKTSYSIELIHYEGENKVRLDVMKKDIDEYVRFVKEDKVIVEKKIDWLKNNKDEWFNVKEIVEDVQESPPKALDTSDALIEAGKKFKFSNDKTTKILNDLFSEGFITYPRTDLKKILDEDFIKSVGVYVEDNYKMKIVRRDVKKTDKTAQEAHEAIRPTLLNRSFDEVERSTSKEHLEVYRMIWRRSIICFMPDCVVKKFRTAYSQINRDILLVALDKKISFPGWRLFDGVKEEGKGYDLPSKLILGEMDSIKLKENVTKPPEEFSEATLIKQMKKHGIGRPSTYASITSTIKNRGYVSVKKNKLVPTQVGFEVIDWLREHLSKYLEIKFTADLESLLDQIATGKIGRVELESKFYDGLLGRVESLPKIEKKLNKTGESCPECESDMIWKKGKYGNFEACSNYPKCKYIKPNQKKQIKELEEKCEQCSSNLVERKGKYGKFKACSNYPKCKYIKKEMKEIKLSDKNCPECGKDMVERKTKKGKMFFGCLNYPKCKGVLWE